MTTIAVESKPPPLAIRAQPGRGPGIFFLCGLRSDMAGTKAEFLAAQAAQTGRAMVRFDYRGHGASPGDFRDFGIGDWLTDSLQVLDNHTNGPQILVGSSLGGWLALLLARARPQRVAGIVGIAAAPDFTEELIWPNLTEAQRRQILEQGVWEQPSAYDPTPLPITRPLLDQGRQHLLLRQPLPLPCPVHLLQGLADPDVPWEYALRLAQTIQADVVRVTLIKEGDHRLSRPADLALLWQTIAGFAA